MSEFTDTDTDPRTSCRAPKGRLARSWRSIRKPCAGLNAQARKTYHQLRHRYGPRFTKAMLIAALGTLFVPVPGVSLVGIAVVVVIAEAHRFVVRRGAWPEEMRMLKTDTDVNP